MDHVIALYDFGSVKIQSTFTDRCIDLHILIVIIILVIKVVIKIVKIIR
jgi:hypothetical protein